MLIFRRCSCREFKLVKRIQHSYLKNPAKSNTKVASNEVDMKGVRSDPIQDKTNSEEMKIHHTESRDYINTKA